MMFGALIEFPSAQGDTLRHDSFHQKGGRMSSEIYQFSTQGLDGQPISLSDHQGKVLLVVNTASRCGFTPQYEQLQALHEEFAPEGLVIIGFPCNQFGGQEPEGSVEIGAFCQKNYGVSFLMSEKVDVNGEHAHALFKYLKANARGVLGTQSIKWNFTKFLVSRQGQVVGRYASMTKPQALREKIKALLG
jgi:glutathione peroxidase